MDKIYEDDLSTISVIPPPLYGVQITNDQALDMFLNNNLATMGIMEVTPGTIPQTLPPPLPPPLP